MIQEYVNRFMEHKEILRARFDKEQPSTYKKLVTRVIEILEDKNLYISIDSTRIHEIDDGDYQGMLLFLIAASNYQPKVYWYVKVNYGSCSGCDTLADASSTEDYLSLALHIVQGLKQLDEDAV